MATITGTFEALAATVLDAVKKTINLVERPDGTLANQQGDASGHAYVVFPPGATAPLPTGAATQTTLAAVLAKLIAAPATEAKQTALNDDVAPGTWTPATGAAPADGAVISAAACTVRSVIVSNRTAATVYLMFFDASAVPADATAPRIPFIAVPATSTIQIALGGLACTAGFCWSTSTTFGVKTIGATTPLVVSAEIV